MAAGLPAVALALAVHDSFALPLLASRDAPRMAAVVEGPVQAEARDGGWVLTGAAETVLNGMGAELLVVGATTDNGPVLFAVDANAAGLQRAPADALLGLDALDVADLRFDAVSVTAADRLDTSLDTARAGYQLALAIAAMAGARTALAMTVDYVKQRKAFGRPIAEFENTRVVLERNRRTHHRRRLVRRQPALPTGATPQTAAAASSARPTCWRRPSTPACSSTADTATCGSTRSPAPTRPPASSASTATPPTRSSPRP